MAPYCRGATRFSWRRFHRLRLERENRLDRLVGVVDVVELDDVGAQVALVAVELVDARARVEVARAVARQDELVTDVDGGELGVRGEDFAEPLEFVGLERRHLGPLCTKRRPVLEIRPNLARRHADERTVAQSRHHALLHRAPSRPCPHRHRQPMPSAGSHPDDLQCRYSRVVRSHVKSPPACRRPGLHAYILRSRRRIADVA